MSSPVERALVTALAGGAPASAAVRAAASVAPSRRLRERWEEASRASDPLSALGAAKLLSPQVRAFLRPQAGAPLATRAEALQRVLMPRLRSYSEMTVGVSALLAGAIVAAGVLATQSIFVWPVFEKIAVDVGMELPQLQTAAVLIKALAATTVLCAIIAFVLRLTSVPGGLTSSGRGIAMLIRTTAAPIIAYQTDALRWLAASARARLAPREVFELVARSTPGLIRYATTIDVDGSPREIVERWASAGLVTPDVRRAAVGLLEHTSDGLDRLARFSERGPRRRTIDLERIVLGVGTLALAACAAVQLGVSYEMINRLGGNP